MWSSSPHASLGVGKATTTLGLAEGLAHSGRRATTAIRPASMGDVVGFF